MCPIIFHIWQFFMRRNLCSHIIKLKVSTGDGSIVPVFSSADALPSEFVTIQIFTANSFC